MTYSTEKIHEMADEHFLTFGAKPYRFTVPTDTRIFAPDGVPDITGTQTIHELRPEVYRLNSRDGSPVLCSLCGEPVTAVTARQEPTDSKLIALHRRKCQAEREARENAEAEALDRTSPPPPSINIRGLDKAAVLLALYRCARVQGMGVLQAKAEPLTIEGARELLENQKRFDYVHGRVLKIDLRGDELLTGLYDRDNGHGAARWALIDAGLIV